MPIMPERAHPRGMPHAHHSYSSSHDVHMQSGLHHLLPPKEAVQRQLEQAAQQAEGGKGRMSGEEAMRKEAGKILDSVRLMQDVVDVAAKDFVNKSGEYMVKPVCERARAPRDGEWAVILRFVIPPEQFQTTNKSIPQPHSARLPNGAEVRMVAIPQLDANRPDRGPSVHNAQYFDFQLRCDDCAETTPDVLFEVCDDEGLSRGDVHSWALAARAVSPVVHSRLAKPRGMLPATLCVLVRGPERAP